MKKIITFIRKGRQLPARLGVAYSLGVGLSLACAFCCGCASSGYMKNRINDGKDVFTVAVGKGYGAKARIGLLHAGAFINRDCAGLRAGMFFSDWKEYSGNFAFMDHPLEIDATLFIIDYTRPMGGNAQARGKAYEAGSRIPFLALPDYEHIPWRRRWPYCTDMVVAGGLAGTLRLGFNPGELVDFLLGWTTIDICGDDVEATKQKQKTNKASDATSETALGAASSSHQR